MGYLLKALALNSEVRIYLVKNTETVNEAIRRHDLWPSAASILGKTLSMGLMMGAMLKQDEAITIKLNGNGPIGNVIVDANGKGEVRGYVDHPHVNFVSEQGGLNDTYALGDDGYLDVIKDLKMKELFTSTIAISGDVAQDFTYYFLESEQTHSAVLLGIIITPENLAQISGGIVVQLMPQATEATILKLEQKLDALESISSLLENHSLEDILTLLFDQDVQILDKMDVHFHCPCTKETFSKSILTLGIEELEAIRKEDQMMDVVCHYCGDKYHFTEQEIIALIEELKK